MDILRHRPLFFCCAVFLLSSAAGLFLNGWGKCLTVALIVITALIYICLRSFPRRDRYRTVLAALAVLIACLGLLQSHLTFQSGQPARLQSLEQSTVSVTGTITDRRGSSSYMSTYTLKLDTVNDIKTKGLALLTCHYRADLFPGNEISLEATLIPLTEAAGDGYDATALMGDGYVTGLLVEEEGTVTILREDSGILSVRAGKLRRQLAANLNQLTGQEAGGLPSALLLGDKSALADSIRRDFSRAGVSHLLAISGLHMTLLFGLLDRILRLLSVPKRPRSVLLMAGAFGYLLLLGFPPSATRAIIMLGVTYLSNLFRATSDSPTSLGLAGALIVAVTPYAVADAGFWMSFLATLGLVTAASVMTEALTRPKDINGKRDWKRILSQRLLKGISAIAVGVIAMTFPLFIVAAVIGEMGVLSPVATILLTPFCGAILLLSLFALPMTGTIGGSLLGGLTGFISRVMIDLTAWMASPSWAVISLRHPAVLPITVAILALTILLLVIRLPKTKRLAVLLPILTGWILLGGVLTLHARLTSHEVNVTYLQPNATSESLVLVSGQKGFVCDLSTGSLTDMNAAAGEAQRQGATELAVYMLTHYHSRTVGSLSYLLNRQTVRALWMPTPANESEYRLLLACQRTAESAGVPVFLYDAGEALRIFGEGALTLETAYIDRSTHPALLISLDLSSHETGKDSLVYCGSAIFESDLASQASTRINDADTVIFGSHGPLHKQPYGALPDYSQTHEIIFSAHGDTAVWFDSRSLPAHTSLWLGQKRLVMEKP